MKQQPNLSKAGCLRSLGWIMCAGWLGTAPHAQAVFRNWLGGAGYNWSTSANWDPAGPPQNGDDLVFNNVPGTSMTNDVPGLSVRSLLFNNGAAVWGASLAVTASIGVSSSSSGTVEINLP